MAQDWNIKPRSTGCRNCERLFVDGQSYWSALWITQDGYARGDHCEACWESQRDKALPHSSWQGVYKVPSREPEPLQKETAESLLRKLMEDEDEANTNPMFILAVMLERKRILVERDVQVDEAGTVTRIYEHRKTGESFLIVDPQLQLDQLESVQERVISLLEGRHDEPSQEADDASSEPTAGASTERTDAS